MQVSAEIQTLEVQANSPRPKRSIVNASFSSLRTILEQAAGAMVASGLLHEIAKFIR